MSKADKQQYNVYVGDTYFGSASWGICRGLLEHPAVGYELDIYRDVVASVKLITTHEESPALVRRVVEAMDEEGEVKPSAGTKAFVTVDGKHIGITTNTSMDWWRRALVETGPPCDIRLEIRDPAYVELSFDSKHKLDSNTLAAVIRALLSIDPVSAKRQSPEDAARAFEEAINSEPGIEVSVIPIGSHNIEDPYPSTKLAVVVTRTNRKQVYP